MAIDDNPTLYDVLDVRPDASPQEVREAYLRTKSTYNKDSVALYTLISGDEREDMLTRIEEAYEILSNSEKRKEYDRHHGLLDPDDDLIPTRVAMSKNKKIISIDRVPPMDSEGGGEDLLVAPSTDFTNGPSSSGDLFSSSEAPVPTAVAATSMTGPGPASMAQQPMTSNASSGPFPEAPVSAPRPTGAATVDHRNSEINREIAAEVDWRGLFLRKVREAKRVSIEEMASVTKITKTYILAIEEENFAKLPAAVYLRGFIIQIAKVLRLPHDKVAAGYMGRYHQARPDKH